MGVTVSGSTGQTRSTALRLREAEARAVEVAYPETTRTRRWRRAQGARRSVPSAHRLGAFHPVSDQRRGAPRAAGVGPHLLVAQLVLDAGGGCLEGRGEGDGSATERRTR